MLVDSIDVFDPDRHPHAFLAGFIPLGPERYLDVALAAPALGVFAQDDLAFTRVDSAEAGRIYRAFRTTESFRGYWTH
jgi:hypothetical protein